MTIGFNAVSSLAAGRVDAATGFWNAEGVALRRQGVPVRIFKVDRYGAPPYPELVLSASRRTVERDPELVRSTVAATTRGYDFAEAHPAQALDDLLAADPRARPRRPGGAAARPAPRPAAAAVRPGGAARNGRPGTSNTACSNARSTSAPRSA